MPQMTPAEAILITSKDWRQFGLRKDCDIFHEL